MDSESAEYEQN
ncbi:unnamed protein product, partial [Didymodactylos carnosus]